MQRCTACSYSMFVSILSECILSAPTARTGAEWYSELHEEYWNIYLTWKSWSEDLRALDKDATQKRSEILEDEPDRNPDITFSGPNKTLTEEDRVRFLCKDLL